MHYIAKFQQHDNVIYTAGVGDDLPAVIAAATAIYTALLPAILVESVKHLGVLTGDHEYWANGASDRPLPTALEGTEYGIGVYDTTTNDLLFWVGAAQNT